NVNDLVEIIGLAARGVKFFDIEPRVAMLSYSNFGSSKGPIPEKASEAVRLAKQKYPDLIVDGDIQANVAFDTEIQSQIFPFSALAKEGANTLIFPNLTAGNIAYKLLMEIGGAEAIGPILLGMKKPVHILQLGSSIRDIISMAAIAVVDAQMHNQNNRL
ncbi:MAG TPA: phosphate acyltransferase, partial [Cyclobacteriaceae bacterium]|nr:phosphate acyltransferase [Cyclobacteriaceae bacterium]